MAEQKIAFDMNAQTWSARRLAIFRARLSDAGRPDLVDRFLALKLVEDATANWLVESSADACVRMTEYLVEYPDEAARLCYMTPAEQRGELDRLAKAD